MEEIAPEEQPPKAKAPQRNTTLYFFEALASFFIIFIHIRFPGALGDLVIPGIARFGVPLFFVVAGFFLIKPGMSREELRHKLKKRIVHVLILIALSAAIYLTLGMIESCIGESKEGVIAFLQTTFSWKKVLMLILLNYPLFNLPTWFLLAMLYAYLILYVFARYFLERKWAAFAFACLLPFWIVFRAIVCITNASIGGHLLSDNLFYCNWLVNGLPFICLGIVLSRHQDLLKRIPLKWVLIVYFASLVLMTLEFSLLIHFFSINTGYYPSHVMNVISIIALSLQKPNLFSRSKLLNLEGNFTAYVYLFHPAIITLISAFLGKLGMSSNAMVSWFKPLIVLALSLVSAIFFNWLVCLVKRACAKGRGNR